MLPYCKRCHKWRTPADSALGLEDSAGYSPAVQAMAALAASKMPVANASEVLEHLAGISLPRATLDREARRQGQCRFRRPGQFWTPAGDEALLCLETFWRNGRWSLLFPHTAFDPARN